MPWLSRTGPMPTKKPTRSINRVGSNQRMGEPTIIHWPKSTQVVASRHGQLGVFLSHYTTRNYNSMIRAINSIVKPRLFFAIK